MVYCSFYSAGSFGSGVLSTGLDIFLRFAVQLNSNITPFLEIGADGFIAETKTFARAILKEAVAEQKEKEKEKELPRVILFNNKSIKAALKNLPKGLTGLWTNDSGINRQGGHLNEAEERWQTVLDYGQELAYWVNVDADELCQKEIRNLKQWSTAFVVDASVADLNNTMDQFRELSSGHDIFFEIDMEAHIQPDALSCARGVIIKIPALVDMKKLAGLISSLKT